MSILEVFRRYKLKTSELESCNEKLLEENKILLEEIRMLKKIMYGIELDVDKLKKKSE